MARSLEELEEYFSRLDSEIEPVGHRPVDLNKPGVFEELAAEPHPLDETGTRAEAEELLLEVISDYMQASSEWRAGVRALFRRFQSFAWAAAIRFDRRTRDGLRAHLIMFSMKDQGPDPRDARLWLSAVCDDARDSEVEIGSILREVAALSSDEDPHGWGSTRRWLEDAA